MPDVVVDDNISVLHSHGVEWRYAPQESEPLEVGKLGSYFLRNTTHSFPFLTTFSKRIDRASLVCERRYNAM